MELESGKKNQKNRKVTRLSYITRKANQKVKQNQEDQLLKNQKNHNKRKLPNQNQNPMSSCLKKNSLLLQHSKLQLNLLKKKEKKLKLKKQKKQ